MLRSLGHRTALPIISMLTISLGTACGAAVSPRDLSPPAVRLSSAEITMPRSLPHPLPGPGDTPPEAIDVSLPPTVRPAPVSDDRLRDQITSRIVNDPSDLRQPVAVAVKDGMVTLQGTLDSRASQQLAYRYAWVPGVLSVDARALRLEAAAVRSPSPTRDVELEREVIMALAADPAQRDSVFDVRATPGGTVTLSGSVKSPRELARAAQAVSTVPGIVALIDKLEVDWRLPPAEGAALLPNLVSVLTWDPRVDGGRVRAQATRNGTVRLSGTVRTRSEANAAIDDAYGSGAKTVVDDLAIVPNAAPSNPR